MSSRCAFMSAHILSKEEAEMTWHLRSTYKYEIDNEKCKNMARKVGLGVRESVTRGGVSNRGCNTHTHTQRQNILTGGALYMSGSL
eukprot:2958546-Pyramimonas_sp.AAC.1